MKKDIEIVIGTQISSLGKELMNSFRNNTQDSNIAGEPEKGGTGRKK